MSLTTEDKLHISTSNYLVGSSHTMTEDGDYLFTSTYEVPTVDHARYFNERFLGTDTVWTGVGGKFQAVGYHLVDAYTYHAERQAYSHDDDPREAGWL